MKEELSHIFTEYFKPMSSLEQEKVEYNEINIFSEYQLYNLVFAKNELMFSFHKAALLLNLCWRLLEFNPDPPQIADLLSELGDGTAASGRLNTTSTIGRQKTLQKAMPTKVDSEKEFANLLAHKFNLFKTLLMESLEEDEKALLLSQEEIRRIADYMKESYFKHLRLYDYALNNKQLCEVKRLTLNVNQPIIATSLGDALQLGQEEALTYEDDVQVIRHDAVS